MTTYHKINSLFKREKNKPHLLILGDYAQEEFDMLKNIIWVGTEKVDGTNIRIIKHLSDTVFDFAGRTDNADIPLPLLDKLHELFDDKMGVGVFQHDAEIVLYGEGYGLKIQNGGKYIRDGVSFVLFDVAVNGIFLERHNVEDVANVLGIDVVPIIKEGTLPELTDFVAKGFNSTWGEFEAEGLVVRPKVELRDRMGRRIITKIKTVDFRKLGM